LRDDDKFGEATTPNGWLCVSKKKTRHGGGLRKRTEKSPVLSIYEKSALEKLITRASSDA